MRFLLQITNLFHSIILDFYILIHGNIARRLGVLGHLLSEIWRESLYYLVISIHIFFHYNISIFITFNRFKPCEMSGFNYRYSVMQFLLPFIVLVYTYTRICISIWRSSKLSGLIDLKRSNKVSFCQRNRDPLISKAMINTVKQMIVVVTLYIVTNIPFIGCELWATWDPKASNSPFFAGKYPVKE